METNSTNISENCDMAVPGVDGHWALRRRSVAICLAAVAVVALSLYLRAKQTMHGYMIDDWLYIGRRQELSFRSLVIDHNGHLSVLPTLVYLSVFYTVGLPGQAAMNAIAIVGHVATMVMVGVVVRRKHGTVAAYLAFLLLGASGLGADIWLWGTNIGFSASVFFVIAAVFCFDKYVDSLENQWRVGMFLCLLAAIGSSGSGVAGLLVSLVMVAASPLRRRLWWVVGIPLGLYLVWSHKYGSVGQLPHIGVRRSISFIVDGVGWSGASVFGVGLGWGRVILACITILVVVNLVSRKFGARRYFWVTFLLVFWTLTAYGRGWYGATNISRYNWVGSIALVLSVADLLPRWSPPRKWVSVLSVAGLVLVLLSVARTEPQYEQMQMVTKSMDTYERLRDSIALGVREKIGNRAGIHTFMGKPYINAEEYFRAVRKFGAPPSLHVADLSRPENASNADSALAEFGFFNRVLVRRDARCSETSSISSVTVDGGESIQLKVDVPSTVVMTRFQEPGTVRPFNSRKLEPGTYILRFTPDTLVRPLSLAVEEGQISQCRQ